MAKHRINMWPKWSSKYIASTQSQTIKDLVQNNSGQTKLDIASQGNDIS